MSTKSAEAQKYFDQGLAYAYGFNHDAAYRSFERASQIDPNCAMAYWGMALVIGPNYNLPEVDRVEIKRANSLVRQARRHSSGASPEDRAYIDALACRYSDDADAQLTQLQQAYADAMAKVSRQYPNDLDAATLSAEAHMNLRPWKLYTPDGKPEPGTEQIVVVLEEVLRGDPNHIGANHYYIHAVEASSTPQRAMQSAKRLPQLAPEQGHLVHMPAHVYMRVGDYPSAIRANQNAIAADDRFVTCCHPQKRGVYTVMYYNHNVHFLMGAACMSGQSKLAIESADKILRDIKPVAAEMPMIEPFGAMPYLARVRFGMWNDILKMPKPPQTMPTTTAAWHFARAMAYTAKGDLPQARAEQAEFESRRAKLAAGPMGNNTITDVMRIGSELLAGKIAAASGDMPKAIACFRKAVATQDKLTYDEPPPWPWPIRETLGAALLATNDPVAAEQVFRDDLTRNPNNGRSLLGLSQSLRTQNRIAEADAIKQQEQRALQYADLEVQLTAF
ncbi:MAG: tetratricopeptide repeat protein [Tepidisphaeraceae bacterium]